MIKYGVIGTSWITQSFIDATTMFDGLNLGAVYSRSIERAQEFCSTNININSKLSIFTDTTKMAQSSEIDAVYIASPNSLHFQQSKLFLENGKHVFCEKPICTSKAEAEILFETARKNNVIFMEGIIPIHTPQLDILKKEIEKIGKISAVRFDYSQLSGDYDSLMKGENPNIFNIDFKTGCIMDIGIYCIYVLLYLFPSYKNIYASAVKLPTTLDLCGTSVFEYEDMNAVVTYSKIANGTTESEIQGDKGTISINMISLLNGISVTMRGENKRQLFIANPTDKPMQYEAQSFYNFITSFEENKGEYEKLSRLAIEVSEVLAIIREKSGVLF